MWTRALNLSDLEDGAGSRLISRSEAPGHSPSPSPLSVTSFSLSQWKTATPRGRDLNKLCVRDKDIFVETCSDDLIAVFEASVPSCLSPSYTMVPSSSTPGKPIDHEQIQKQPILELATSVGHSPSPPCPPHAQPSSLEKQARHGSVLEGRAELEPTHPLECSLLMLLGPEPSEQEKEQHQEQERSTQGDTADRAAWLTKCCAPQTSTIGEEQGQAGGHGGESALRALNAASLWIPECSILVSSGHPALPADQLVCSVHSAVDFSRRHPHSAQTRDEYLADLSNTSIDSTMTCSVSPSCSQKLDAQSLAEQSIASARPCETVQQLQETLDAGNHSALLALLRALLDKKNVQIAKLTSALSSARASSDTMQRDLRSEESKLAHLRLAIHVRDKMLQRQSQESSVHQARLSEYVATLAAQNESLRQLHRADTVKNQLEQDEMLQTIQDSMRREAALEGQRAAEQREKDLLLAHASKRLQTQAQRVREYQHLLEAALSDKSRLEKRLAGEQTGGMEEGGEGGAFVHVYMRAACTPRLGLSLILRFVQTVV